MASTLPSTRSGLDLKSHSDKLLRTDFGTSSATPTAAPLETVLINRIQTAINANPYLAGRQLRFEASSGRIVLRGVVASWFQKQMAQEALRDIAGAVDIENQLVVQWGG